MKNITCCTEIRQGLKQQNFLHVLSSILILVDNDLDSIKNAQSDFGKWKILKSVTVITG